MEVTEHETRDRIITGLVTVLPILALVLVGWQLWNSALHWHDLVVFGVVYVLTGLGVTVGFHRYLTHRSFATTRWLRAVLAALGSAAVEGPVISWVADHRKHHAFSDQEGDPHSPHVGHEGAGAAYFAGSSTPTWAGCSSTRSGAPSMRYAPDLFDDPIVSFVDRTFVLWVAVGLAVPFGLGAALGGTVAAGLTGLLWGGAVRIFVLHHITYSINSLCHFFGRRRFETGDESRNLAWLARSSFGEAWHNNHHAFPTSAAHGLRRWSGARPLGAPDPDARAGRPRLGRGPRRPERQQRKAPGERPEARALPAPPGARAGASRPPVHGRLWDGSRCRRPAERPHVPVRSPKALAHLLRAPGQLGLGRAYVRGLIEVDDMDAAVELLDSWSRRRSPGSRCGWRSPPPCRPGLAATARAPGAELRQRGRRHSVSRDARAVRHHYDVGNEFFELFLDSR